MRVNVTVRDLQPDPSMIAAVERRIRIALGRFTNHIRQADVTLADVNGPRGGADQLCRLRVSIPNAPAVVIETTGSDPLAAVGDAGDRAARRVSETVSKRRELHRGSGTLRPRIA